MEGKSEKTANDVNCGSQNRDENELLSTPAIPKGKISPDQIKKDPLEKSSKENDSILHRISKCVNLRCWPLIEY